MKGMQKIKRGKSFAGVVLYALKLGMHHKSDPVVIGGNMLGASATELIAEFIASASLRTDILKPVWHNSLRLPQGEFLTAKQWIVFADDYMNRMGISETHIRCYVLHDDEAVSIPADILLMGAGWTQSRAGTSQSNWGHWYSKPPYGHDPRDQFWIKQGIDYAKQHGF